MRGSQLLRAGAGEVGIPGPQGGLLLEAGGQYFKAVNWQEIEPSDHHPQPVLQDPPPEKQVGCWQPLLRGLSLWSRGVFENQRQEWTFTWKDPETILILHTVSGASRAL